MDTSKRLVDQEHDIKERPINRMTSLSSLHLQEFQHRQQQKDIIFSFLCGFLSIEGSHGYVFCHWTFLMVQSVNVCCVSVNGCFSFSSSFQTRQTITIINDFILISYYLWFLRYRNSIQRILDINRILSSSFFLLLSR